MGLLSNIENWHFAKDIFHFGHPGGGGVNKIIYGEESL